jgi:hypothetical protein
MNGNASDAIQITQEMIDRRNAENGLREYIRDEVIHSKELKGRARIAKEEAWRKANEALSDLTGTGEFIHPNSKASGALERLSSKVRDMVIAHGLGSNVPTTDPDFPIAALIAALATGELKGDTATLSSGRVFENAPFILLSNKGEQLAEDRNGKFKLTNLRTILVNGEYESIVQDLRNAFPGVSFRTASEIQDDVFDKRQPVYRSFEDQIAEHLDKHAKDSGFPTQIGVS